MLDAKKTLTDNVRTLIDKATQDRARLDLAKQMGVADGTLGRIKYGNGNPNVETLEQIARFFRIEAYQLLTPGMARLERVAVSSQSQEGRPFVSQFEDAVRTLYEEERAGRVSPAAANAIHAILALVNATASQQNTPTDRKKHPAQTLDFAPVPPSLPTHQVQADDYANLRDAINDDD